MTVLAALLAPVATVAMPASVTALPASFRGHDVFLKVRLNGGAPVWMKFDIGAAGSSLTSAYVHGDARRAARMSVTLGAVTLPGVFFDLSKSPAGLAPDGSIVAGRLGQDWLGNRMVEVRYRQHEVWMSAPIDPVAPRKLSLASAALP